MEMISSHGTPAQPMDSRQLLAFVTLARTGSFTAAGHELSLSSSAVSHSLKAFEAELGQQLFNRIGKRVSLTPAGEHLLHHAAKILADMDKARQSLEALAQWGKGRLRVGASDSICQYFIPAVLRAFHRELSGWPIRVTTADTQQCLEAIRQKQIDFAIAIAPNQNEPVEMHPLFSDELLWMVSPRHPWALSGDVPRDEIPRQRLIFSAAAGHAFRMVRAYYERDGLRLNLALELDSYEAAKELVRAEEGVTVMASWMAHKELAEGTLVALPLGRRKLRRNWGLFRSPDSKADFAEMSFVKHCHQTARALGLLPNVSPAASPIVQIARVMAAALSTLLQPFEQLALFMAGG
jgi:LysR family transcriptional regulator, low CO2-responsive transcriptional regulator